MNIIKSRTFIAIPPGATLREQLRERRMTQKELACRMSMSTKHISKLINGEAQMTPATALKLESVLGIPAEFWCNLESIYQLNIIRATKENQQDTINPRMALNPAVTPAAVSV